MNFLMYGTGFVHKLLLSIHVVHAVGGEVVGV